MKHIVVTEKNVMSWNKEKHTLRYAAQNVVYLASMCFVWFSEQTAITSLYNINWLVFVTEAYRVYCAVRTEYYIWLRSYLKKNMKIPMTFALRNVMSDIGEQWIEKHPNFFIIIIVIIIIII
jgi:hypothetical protein